MIERARSEGLEPAAPDDFRSVTGTGVVASLDGRDVVVGTPDLLSERGVNSGGAADALEAMRSRGRTAVLVASDGEVLGVIAIADRVEEGSRDAIGQLRTIGVEPVTMTGDHEGTARAVGAEVGIGRILADVLPDEKAEEIGRLQDQGHRVATVGDGINDGPALTRPDVCVALGAGTDIALESADLVLMHSRLSGVVAAFEVIRNSYRKTNQNVALASAFNGVGVPVSAAGIPHPISADGGPLPHLVGPQDHGFQQRRLTGTNGDDSVRRC